MNSSLIAFISFLALIAFIVWCCKHYGCKHEWVELSNHSYSIERNCRITERGTRYHMRCKNCGQMNTQHCCTCTLE